MNESVRILYEDAAILVAVKPCGMPSQPDPSGAPDLLSHLQGRFGEVYLVHRLDRRVGGITVLARNKAAAASLGSAVSNHVNFRKEYLAVSAMRQEACELVNYLFHDRRLGKAFPVKGERKGAKRASLSFAPLESRETEVGELTLYRVLLHTGRFHQIRVQFATHGMPLYGDGKYGSRIKGSIGLWAHSLAFLHPVSGEQLSFSAPPPAELPWTYFSSRELA